MAYQRLSDSTKTDQNVRILGDGLDAFVSNSIKLYDQQVTIRDNADEANFQELVSGGTMPLKDQLDYRKQQLSRTKNPTTRADIKTKIASLTAQVKQKDFVDGYTKNLQDHAAGIESIDSIVSWLKDQLSTATDTAVIDKINSELVTQEGNRFTMIQNTLKEQTNFASKNQSDKVISDQIERLITAKNNAILSGDKETAANLDVQLQILNQSKAENSIKMDMQNLAVATITGASSATSLLDAYNSKISSADPSQPITVNGVSYSSARDFWTFTRDSYLADSGNSGFFPRVSDEVSTNLKVKNSQNTLSASDIATASSKFASLASRPELANYTSQIDINKQSALQTGTDLLTAKISNTYDQNLDLNKAVSDLGSLKSLGVNVDSAMTKILTSATSLKSSNVQSIVSAAQDLMSSTPGLSITDAVTRAIQKGAGVILSPNELLSKSSTDVASTQLGAASKGANTEDTSKTTVSPANQPTAGVSQPSTVATSSAGAAAPGTTYTVKSGDTLSAIAALHGMTVAALAQANNISDPNVIQAGVALKIPGNSSQQPSPTPSQPTPQVASAPKAPAANPAPASPSPTPVASSVPANPTPNPKSPTVAAGTYTIKSGDTLGAIAAAHGTSVSALAKLNGIQDANKIQAGATLKLA